MTQPQTDNSGGGNRKEMIQSRIEKLLSKEYHCSVEALHEKGTVYSVKSHTEQPYIKILAYRNAYT